MKTTTIFVGADPKITFLKGHADQFDFHKAYTKEGIIGPMVSKAGLKHEYWVPLKNGFYKKARKTTPYAIPVTVARW